MKYESSLKAKLIYIFRINDDAHSGCLKIGEASLSDNFDVMQARPNSHELNQAAKTRISQYTKTASIQYELLHTEITIYFRNGKLNSFNDKEVHDVLMRSGIRKHDFSHGNQGSEWFECDLNTALEAIKAIKEGKSAIADSKITKGKSPIVFRPEQRAAIDKTVRQFKKGKAMLWNAKMRFGKTLSALQVVKECHYHRTLILTHRPVVDDGWFEDFGKIFQSASDGYRYGSRNMGFEFDELERDASRNADKHYVYFASMQDLRGSKEAGGKFDKNDEIFSAPWNMLIVDEAHEGTQTKLGQSVLELLTKSETRVLNLSGTPFNLLDDYQEDQIYTWDYVMEQRAKQEWDLNHFGDPNPYAGLPRLNLYAFDLGKIIGSYEDVDDKAFNFKEFFRTWTGNPETDHRKMPADTEVGRFIHEKDVRLFLDLIVKYDKESNYPYSTVEYRQNFRHSLWMVPGVKEAKALSELLRNHPIFSAFQVVNVAGEGDDDEENEEALKMLRKAMGDDPSQTYTITLSCGRLTTGVTVAPWTAVFMLAGSSSTDAKAYMQTIFRVQSPYESRDGKRKEECFVFDFAPDRTLKVIAEVAQVSRKNTGQGEASDKDEMGEFLNFCPIISYNGTKMEALSTERMMEQLKRVYVDKVVRHGFEDTHLYNDNLLKMTDVDLRKFDNLHRIIGSTKANNAGQEVEINKQGFDNEEYEKVKKAQKKKKRELTEEEKRLLEEAKRKRENANRAASILRGISIRMPLLIYGARLKDEEKELRIQNFSTLVDDTSWVEFMPQGVTKELFDDFIKYYDEDIFRAAGRQIREMARATDHLEPLERVKRIARIFGYFRNPDKETVLTPWRVVNMHMSDCVGGYDFWDSEHKELLDVPRLVKRDNVTSDVFEDPETRILEINSKTGLYPLYMTFSVFMSKCQAYRDSHRLATDIPVSKQIELWDEALRDNIFVICKTEMAKCITRRTLAGFRDVKVHTRCFDDLINQIKNKPDQFITKVRNGRGYWKANNETTMNFNAIVGNPPYQVMDGGAGASAMPVYNKFVDISRKLKPHYISIIMPSRWMTGGRGLDEFRDSMLDDHHIERIYDYFDARTCFENVEIKGGICYFLWNNAHDSECKIHTCSNGSTSISERFLRDNGGDIFIRDNYLIELKNLVQSYAEETFDTIVSSMKPYGIRGDFFKSPAKYGLPDLEEVQGDCPFSIIGLDEGLRRITKYMPEGYPIPKKDMLQDYKIFITRNYGNGTIGELPASPIIAEPGMLCTETFVQIGPFQNKKFANNCLSYMKTKFFRIMVGLRKQDQSAGKDVYAYVPIPKEGFAEPWTDDRLIEKYNISPSLVDYINTLCK